MRRRACSVALGLLLSCKLHAQPPVEVEGPPPKAAIQVEGPPPNEIAPPKTAAPVHPAMPEQQMAGYSSDACDEGFFDVSGGTRGFWFSGEYLIWFPRGFNTPALVTTSPAGAPIGTAAVIGQPGTTVLAGGDVDFGSTSGFRFTVGMSLPSYDGWGVEMTWLFAGNNHESQSFVSNANGAPTLGRPFLSAITGNEAVNYAAFAGPPAPAFSGRIDINYESDLWGAEFNLVSLVECEDWWPTLSVGFRYMDLEDEVNITQRSTVLPGAALLVGGNTVVTNPDGVRVRDSFDTRNQFYGGQVAARSHLDWGGLLTFDIGAKLALGATHQSVNISGQTEVVNNIGIPVQTVNGGLLAVRSNSGQRSRNVFSVIPEVNLKANLPLTSGLSLFAGYDFIYWSNVARAGDQIDRRVNVTQVPTSAAFGLGGGPALPQVPFESTDYWVHGVNFGLSLSF